MAKKRISATIDKETLEKLKRILKKGQHRNYSHIIEDAIKLYEKEKK
jgi:metal-responsive CopG/Arc/MetJ family transcriptional regulator